MTTEGVVINFKFIPLCRECRESIFNAQVKIYQGSQLLNKK